MMIAKVAVILRARGLDKLFDYLVPQNMWLTAGHRVEVPFGKRKVEGYIMDLVPSEDRDNEVHELKFISRLMDDPFHPILGPDLVKIVHFLRDRYVCTWGAALQTVLPPATRTKETRRLALADNVETFAQGNDHRYDELFIYMKAHGSVPEESVQKRFGISSLQIRKFIVQGWLKEDRRITLRVAPKRIKMVQWCGEQGVQKPSLGRVQQRIADYMWREQRPISWDELRRETGATTATLHLLEERHLLTIWEEDVEDVYQPNSLEASFALTKEQEDVMQQVNDALDERKESVFLLHGVTGSGKTEIYLQAIDKVLCEGKSAIMLVPEIALTTQMTTRFKKRFGDRLAVLHSRLSDREKNQQWQNIHDGKTPVVIGARSAIFAPVKDLALIIIDEEHESSYKQDKEPRYLVREVAVHRCKQALAVLLLGSATPSLEAMYRAEKGAYHLLSLPHRVQGRALPTVNIVDMREQMRHGQSALFSPPLKEALQDVLKRKEQAILFLNRRGYSTFVLCRDCGQVATCPSCDISLTLHKEGGNVLRCHICGYKEIMQPTCRHCSSTRVRPFGTGTQRVEQELLAQFDDLRVIRMDVDTTSTKGSHERLLQAFERGEADVLLGTQMIAKGLDFKRVSLVGVIAADTALHLPDYRACERTFDLLVQVAGRAGRHDLAGQMIVQTFNPDHYAISLAATQNYTLFYETEMRVRKNMEYPPYTEVSVFGITHRDEVIAREFAIALHDDLTQRLQGMKGVRLFPAAPAAVARMRGLYRFQVIVKYHAFVRVQKVLETCYKGNLAIAPLGMHVVLDVNAQSI